MQEPSPAAQPDEQERLPAHHPFAHADRSVRRTTDDGTPPTARPRQYRQMRVDPSGTSGAEAYSVDQAQGLQHADQGGFAHYSTWDPVEAGDRLPPGTGSPDPPQPFDDSL